MQAPMPGFWFSWGFLQVYFVKWFWKIKTGVEASKLKSVVKTENRKQKTDCALRQERNVYVSAVFWIQDLASIILFTNTGDTCCLKWNTVHNITEGNVYLKFCIPKVSSWTKHHLQTVVLLYDDIWLNTDTFPGMLSAGFSNVHYIWAPFDSQQLHLSSRGSTHIKAT